MSSQHLRALQEQAVKHNFRLEGKTKGGHIVFIHTSGRKVHCSSTPSCRHAAKNAAGDFARVDRMSKEARR